jgi:hypothetical protein
VKAHNTGRRIKELRRAYMPRIEAGERVPSLSALAEKLGTTALYLPSGDAHAPCPLCRTEAR